MPKPTSIVLDLVHQKIHEGVFFVNTKVYKGIANDDFVRLHIKSTTKSAHIVIAIAIEGKAYWKSYDGTTYTDDGTAIPTFNRIVNGGKAPTCEIYEDPTIDVIGTDRGDFLIPAGTGGNATGGTGGSRVESIIPAGEDLLLEIQNVSGQVRDVGVWLEWYEVDRGGAE